MILVIIFCDVNDDVGDDFEDGFNEGLLPPFTKIFLLQGSEAKINFKILKFILKMPERVCYDSDPTHPYEFSVSQKFENSLNVKT